MIYFLGMSLERQPSAPTLYAHVEARLLERIRRDFRLDRLRTLDGRPFCFMTTELPWTLAPDLPAHGLPEESLYAWLRRRHRLVPHRADEEVAARPPLPREAKFLGADVAVVLVVRRH